jgi:serine/threonine-protein kinase 24/25/MST4
MILSTTNENLVPPALLSAPPVDPASKEGLLGRRLYSKALEPTLGELHAQTATKVKREALARLTDAFAVLDNVDPEGAYHLLRNLVTAVSQDSKLNAAFLPSHASLLASKIPTDDATPQGTVVIKSQQQLPPPQVSALAPPTSPSKLLLSQANPHLKSHRRRQSLMNDVGAMVSPEKEQRDREKAAFEARLPGREPPAGMEHVKQISDVLYAQWVGGLRKRWSAAVA